MPNRTTILLDDEAHRAVRELAMRYGCSPAEAVRRAVLCQRDALFGAPSEARRERVRTLNQLSQLFQGSDSAARARHLAAEDDGF
jgi:hypothetical protein